MTAEIGILNPSAVALAADSAVTIGIHNGQKIYNSANKLFTLSKYHPVGIMIYGNAEIMMVPWETVIKVYRQTLGTDEFDTLEEYVASFITFLETSFFSENIQKQYLISVVSSYFQKMVGDVRQNVEELLREKSGVGDKETKDVLASIVTKHHDEWIAADRLPTLPNDFPNQFRDKFQGEIDKLITNIFDRLPLTKKLTKMLHGIAESIFSRNGFPITTSGVVIAGFGKAEIFPSLVELKVECVVDNVLKYLRVQQVSIGPESEGQLAAAVVPFAQSEMVDTFIGGIDPQLDEFATERISQIFQKYPQILTDAVISLVGDEIENKEEIRKNLLSNLSGASEQILNDYMNDIQYYRQKIHVEPIIKMAQFLPKDELAEMAEALVNLTSFKRRISMSAETVGGPIDVAVISKGDGFIWVKRKHYFKAELNRQFFDRYYLED